MLNKETIFDEKVILTDLFQFDSKIRKKIYNLTIVGESNQIFARAIIKYLLHVCNFSPLECEDLIRKYMVIFIYIYMRDKTDDVSLITHEFLEMAFRKLSLKDLKIKEFEKDNIFTELYLKEDIKQYAENLKTLEKIIVDNDILKEAKANSFVNILRKDNHFFYQNKSKFDDLDKYSARNYDEMIAETLLENDMFKFRIHIEDDQMDAFFSNFADTKSLDDLKKIRKFIFGYMIYDIFKNQNYVFRYPVKLLPSTKLKLYLGMKNANASDSSGRSVMKFIKDDERNRHCIDVDAIVPFNFKYNGIEYRFSKAGVIKL